MAITTQTADRLVAMGAELSRIGEALCEAGHKRIGEGLLAQAANVASAGMLLRGGIEMYAHQALKEGE